MEQKKKNQTKSPLHKTNKQKPRNKQKTIQTTTTKTSAAIKSIGVGRNQGSPHLF